MTPTNTIRRNLIYVLLLTALTMTGCWGGQQPKAYASQLTSSDSMSIQMGNYTLMKYHSDRLGFDINYPRSSTVRNCPTTQACRNSS